ncbi:MAG: hypothetical protein ACTHOD_17025 [Motilibacteraceae bacterium]
MPWNPDFSEHHPGPRLERYRDRVGRLQRDGQDVGLVLVQVAPYAEQTGGRLWWRRWSPARDALGLLTILDGRISDHFLADDIATELDAYDAGRFEYLGERFCVVWLDRQESARLRVDEFGV